jgi:hypothetical protein
MSTLAHVVRDVAAVGELPDRIPVAAIACKEAGESERHEAGGCWAHGHVVCPGVAGFPYAFDVDAFGTIRDAAEGTNHASLAAYSDVLRHALGWAARWLAELADSPRPALPAPHPICGKRIHFGSDPERNEDNEIKQWVLAATPAGKYGIRRGLRISQGGLFEATVNLRELHNRKLHRVFWCSDAYPSAPKAVLIKVSSASCFNQLIPSVAAYLYGLEPRYWRADVEIRQVLSQSLYGAYQSPRGGLVQLLPDLALQEYTTLCPSQWLHPTGGGGLWGAFTAFVKGVLLPLAKYDIVHADVRAGHDVTSNVLYNPKKMSMRLIDLDSLCSFKTLSLHLPPVGDDRNINPKILPPAMKTSRGYVLVQVVCVAEAWLQRIPNHSVIPGQFIADLATSYREVYGNVNIENDAPINEALTQYTRRFERTFRE